jgi:hypothetical protein
MHKAPKMMTFLQQRLTMTVMMMVLLKNLSRNKASKKRWIQTKKRAKYSQASKICLLLKPKPATPTPSQHFKLAFG